MHPNFTPALRGILACHLAGGDYESSRPYLERLRTTPGRSAIASMFDARFLAAAGKKEEAARITAEALQKVGVTDFGVKMLLALAFWDVGDDKKAFELLDEAVRERAGFAPTVLPAYPLFDSMRGDPRFQALLDQMNLPPLPPDHPVAILAREREEKARAKTEKPIEKIAVLPFANISGDPEQEWFVDGMTDALITELAKIKALTVISRTSAMQYKNVLKPMQEIARELGVDALVEGSVMRVGHDVRVTAQLIRGATDSHLWAESYTGTLENILKLQGEVAMAIAKAIRVAVTPEEEKRITTAKRVDPEAYEAYLRGRFFFWKFTPDGIEKAVESCQRAVELDPDYAEAYGLLGAAYWVPAVRGFVPPASAVERARPAIDTALALDDTLAGAHAMAGWIALSYDWDWACAEREFRRAIEVNTGEPAGHDGLGRYYLSLGRFDDAIREMQEAIDLDPLNLLYRTSLTSTYTWAGRYEVAIAERRKVLELDPAFLSALSGASLDYILVSRYDDAIEVDERAMAIHGRLPLLLSHLVWAHAAAGRKADAGAVLAELHAKDRDEYVGATTFALAYAALGDMDEAFRRIDQAIEDRDFLLTQPYWPGWGLFRGDPRFLDMLRRINYPAIEEFETAMRNAASADTGQTALD